MGLEKIKNFAKKLNSLTLSELIGYAYDDREFLDEVVGYNQEQLLDGRLSNDVYLPKYSEASQREYNKPNIRIQLKDTGDFYRSLKARRNGNEIIFTGDTNKEDVDLEQKYTKHVFGIDSQNMGEVEKLVGEFVVEGLRAKFKPK